MWHLTIKFTMFIDEEIYTQLYRPRLMIGVRRDVNTQDTDGINNSNSKLEDPYREEIRKHQLYHERSSSQNFPSASPCDSSGVGLVRRHQGQELHGQCPRILSPQNTNNWIGDSQDLNRNYTHHSSPCSSDLSKYNVNFKAIQPPESHRNIYDHSNIVVEKDREIVYSHLGKVEEVHSLEEVEADDARVIENEIVVADNSHVSVRKDVPNASKWEMFANSQNSENCDIDLHQFTQKKCHGVKEFPVLDKPQGLICTQVPQQDSEIVQNSGMVQKSGMMQSDGMVQNNGMVQSDGMVRTSGQIQNIRRMQNGGHVQKDGMVQSKVDTWLNNQCEPLPVSGEEFDSQGSKVIENVNNQQESNKVMSQKNDRRCTRLQIKPSGTQFKSPTVLINSPVLANNSAKNSPVLANNSGKSSQEKIIESSIPSMDSFEKLFADSDFEIELTQELTQGNQSKPDEMKAISDTHIVPDQEKVTHTVLMREEVVDISNDNRDNNSKVCDEGNGISNMVMVLNEDKNNSDDLVEAVVPERHIHDNGTHYSKETLGVNNCTKLLSDIVESPLAEVAKCKKKALQNNVEQLDNIEDDINQFEDNSVVKAKSEIEQNTDNSKIAETILDNADIFFSLDISISDSQSFFKTSPSKSQIKTKEKDSKLSKPGLRMGWRPPVKVNSDKTAIPDDASSMIKVDKPKSRCLQLLQKVKTNKAKNVKYPTPKLYSEIDTSNAGAIENPGTKPNPITIKEIDASGSVVSPRQTQGIGPNKKYVLV